MEQKMLRSERRKSPVHSSFWNGVGEEAEMRSRRPKLQGAHDEGLRDRRPGGQTARVPVSSAVKQGVTALLQDCPED